ncbi:MAG: hypothetical protein AB7N76_14170 [Planctomycetota bacterium]
MSETVRGKISKQALADIFARADSLVEGRKTGRQPGRLGRAMLDQLLARAAEVREADAPAQPGAAVARPDDAPGAPRRPEPAPAAAAASPPAAPRPRVRSDLIPSDLIPPDELAPEPPAKPWLDLSSSSDELGVLPDVPPSREEAALASPASAPPSLHQLRSFLSESAEDFASRTMLEELELPGGTSALEVELSSARELSFEGDEDELARLLEDTYRHYRSGVKKQIFVAPPQPAIPPLPPTANELRLGSGGAQTFSVGGGFAPARPQRPQAAAPPTGAPQAPATSPPPSVPPRSSSAPGSKGPASVDPFANDPFERYDPNQDPFELAGSAAPTDPSSEARRSFERHLVARGVGAMLERRRPPAGEPSSVPIRLLYDPQRRLFGAAVEPRLQTGDRFQLRDGRIFRVSASALASVHGRPTCQEVAAVPLGALRSPLHESWDGQFPR